MVNAGNDSKEGMESLIEALERHQQWEYSFQNIGWLWDTVKNHEKAAAVCREFGICPDKAGPAVGGCIVVMACRVLGAGHPQPFVLLAVPPTTYNVSGGRWSVVFRSPSSKSRPTLWKHSKHVKRMPYNDVASRGPLAWTLEILLNVPCHLRPFESKSGLALRPSHWTDSANRSATLNRVAASWFWESFVEQGTRVLEEEDEEEDNRTGPARDITASS